MYKALTTANRKLQQKRIDSTLWTKGDILAFGKLLNSTRFSSEERRKDICSLREQLDWTINYNGKGYAITEEQSRFGIQWLKSRILTKSGKLSKSKFAQDFRERDAEVIRNFERFEFVGFYANDNGWSNHYTPIYRTIAKDGTYFDYTMVGGQWGSPEVLDWGQITPKLERILA